jgi:hypothetical protein
MTPIPPMETGAAGVRSLFATYAARPHLSPMAPLAGACLLAGHEVRMTHGQPPPRAAAPLLKKVR